MNERIDLVERKLRVARGVAVTAIAVAIIAFACNKHDATAEPPKGPTSIELATADGKGSVSIDGSGIMIRSADGTTHVGPSEIAVGGQVFISNEHVLVKGNAGTTTVAAGVVTLEHAPDTVKLTVDKFGARVSAKTNGNEADLSSGSDGAEAAAHALVEYGTKRDASPMPTRPAEGSRRTTVRCTRTSGK